MITDNIKNIHRYSGVHPLFPLLMEFINNFDRSKYQKGKFEIDGDNFFGIGLEYQTKPAEEALWEGHKKYIDIHWVISGSEKVEISPEKEATIIKEYDPENDYFLCEASGERLSLKKDDILILYPGEVHKTSIAIDDPENLIKIVFKLRYDA
jgi:YhcH/YjgK/YiaL family protein